MLEVVQDTPANRRKGWRRMVLFGLGFQPGGIKIRDISEALMMIKDVPSEMRRLGAGTIPFDGGFYPWDWVKSEEPNFKALLGGVFVAPILQKLILNREPERVLDFVDKVCEWDFTRLIPCHLGDDIRTSPKAFRDAFSFLEEGSSSLKRVPRAFEEDCGILNAASENLTKQGTLYPVAKLIKGRKRRR